MNSLVSGSIAIEPKAIEALLLQQPPVTEAAVIADEEEGDGTQLIAYVAADLAHVDRLPQKDLQLTDTALVDRWHTLYDVTYGKAPAAPSFAGWTSSYTRQAIPEPEMREWLEATVERIRSLRPARVLEIGCGVGLLLQHLAPQCERYVGTDFSAPGLSGLQKWMSSRQDLRHVELLQRAATDLQDLQGEFDTIVLNSVVQYFPNVDYLLTVLKGALRVLGPTGGQIFLGDLRNLNLLPTFHSAVQLSRAADSVSVRQLRRRIARALTQETELAIDPELFRALPTCLTDIAAVDVQLRRGQAQNELTRYRYDAVLYKGGTQKPRSTPAPVTLHLTSLRNQRLAGDHAAQELIQTSARDVTAKVLRSQLQDMQPDGVDPEEVYRLAESLGCRVSLRPHDSHAAANPSKPWDEYANSPLENSIGQRLIAHLRNCLKQQLPDPAIPKAWTILKHLPRTANGEVDRRAL